MAAYLCRCVCCVLLIGLMLLIMLTPAPLALAQLNMCPGLSAFVEHTTTNIAITVSAAWYCIVKLR